MRERVIAIRYLPPGNQPKESQIYVWKRLSPPTIIPPTHIPLVFKQKNFISNFVGLLIKKVAVNPSSLSILLKFGQINCVPQIKTEKLKKSRSLKAIR